MSVSYYLYPNPLKSGNYLARVHTKSVVDQEASVKRLARRIGSLNEGQIRMVVEELVADYWQCLCEGRRVKIDGLVSLAPSIKGTFEDSNDGFDRARHELGVKVVPSVKLVKEMRRNGRVAKQKHAPKTPWPEWVYDPRNKDSETLTSGDVCTIDGTFLKFNPENEGEGVWFTHLDNNERFRADVLSIESTRLIVCIPKLPAGDYQVAVASHPRGSKTLRTGKYEHLVQVREPHS